MAVAPIEVEFSVDTRPAVRALRQASISAVEAIGGAEAVAELLREWAEQEGMTLPHHNPSSTS